MRTLRFILADQLSRSVSSLRDLDPEHDVVLRAEVEDEATYVRHHKQKIVLVLSAMRHFAESLRDEGTHVDYVRLDDEENAGSWAAELRRAVARHCPTRIVVTEPGEWRLWEMMAEWRNCFAKPLEILENDRFLCTRAEFANWVSTRKTLRMEHFYRQMRRKTGWLMDSGKPEGGKWSYDPENRKALPEGLHPPGRSRFAPDEITR